MAEVPAQPQIQQPTTPPTSAVPPQQPVQQTVATQPTSTQQPNVKVSYLGVYTSVAYLVLIGLLIVLPKIISTDSSPVISVAVNFLAAPTFVLIVANIAIGIKSLITASKTHNSKAMIIGIFTLFIGVLGILLFLWGTTTALGGS